MEKLITMYPYQSKYKAMFEEFKGVMSSYCSDARKAEWGKYQEIYKFRATHFGSQGEFRYLDWTNLYKDVPETVELWTITGEDFGLDEPIGYDMFSRILKGRGFICPPFATGMWLAEAFSEQNITFEGELWIFSPIVPTYSKPYKTVQIVLHKSEDGITGTLESLRPTEDLIHPRIRRVVQRVLD
jgi:hypothetical protein